jgi:hypothetical protein
MKSTDAGEVLFFEPRIDNESHSQSQLCGGHESAARCRCACGALLARWVAAGLELKCRRCKRTTLIPFPTSCGPRPSRPEPDSPTSRGAHRI